MALAKAIRMKDAEEYYEKNKVTVDEMTASAQTLLERHWPILKKLPTAATAGILKNKTHSPLLLGPTHDWSGSEPRPEPASGKAVGLLVPYTPEVAVGDSGHFLHATRPTLNEPHMDMAAVVYTTGKSANAWLLAWSIGQHSLPKVYVEAGPLNKITKWDDIKEKLILSRDMSFYEDHGTKTMMFAKISYGLGIEGRIAAIYTKY